MEYNLRCGGFRGARTTTFQQQYSLNSFSDGTAPRALGTAVASTGGLRYDAAPMGIKTVSLIIAAFVSGSLGVAALMRNYRSRLCFWFWALSMLLFIEDAISLLGHFEAVSARVSPLLHSFTASAIGLCSLRLLALLVPQYSREIRRWAYLYISVALLLLLGFGLGGAARLGPWIGPLARLSLLLPAGLWLRFLHRGQAKSALSRERLRLRYAFWGGTFALGLFLTDAFDFAGYRVPPMGTLALLFYQIFLFQTFIQKEFMTSQEVVAKVALFGSVAFTLSTIYVLLVSWVGDRPDLFYFNTLIASFAILVLFDPIRNLTSRFTRRLFLQRNSVLEEQLNVLSSELLGVVEPKEIVRLIELRLGKSLGIESSALYLLDKDGLSYVRVPTSNRPGFPDEISTGNPLVEYMTLRAGRPFVLDTLETDRDTFYGAQSRRFCETCIEALRSFSADCVLPFLHQSQITGFWLASATDRTLLSTEQLRSFIPVSRQIASLLKNAQAFVRLRDRDKLAALGEMSAGLAHEIKNPLGAIQGAADLLCERLSHEADPANRDFAEIIRAETRRLSKVVSDFLDYARPRRGTPETNCDPVRVIEHTAALCLRDSRVQFVLDTPKSNIMLELDPETLKQVLLNLFLNALQAMHATPAPVLRVRLSEIRRKRAVADPVPFHKLWEGWDLLKTSEGPSWIEIAVEDNGCGIQPDDAARIFQPFFTTKTKGTGLGLAICHRLIEELGGSIAVKPRTPEGTVFLIHLPQRVREHRRFESPSPRLRTKELPV